MVRFEQLQPNDPTKKVDFEIYDIYVDVRQVAKFMLPFDKEKYNTVLNFHGHKQFDSETLLAVAQGIKEKFGNINFVI